MKGEQASGREINRLRFERRRRKKKIVFLIYFFL